MRTWCRRRRGWRWWWRLASGLGRAAASPCRWLGCGGRRRARGCRTGRSRRRRRRGRGCVASPEHCVHLLLDLGVDVLGHALPAGTGIPHTVTAQRTALLIYNTHLLRPVECAPKSQPAPSTALPHTRHQHSAAAPRAHHATRPYTPAPDGGSHQVVHLLGDSHCLAAHVGVGAVVGLAHKLHQLSQVEAVAGLGDAHQRHQILGAGDWDRGLGNFRGPPLPRAGRESARTIGTTAVVDQAEGRRICVRV